MASSKQQTTSNEVLLNEISHLIKELKQTNHKIATLNKRVDTIERAYWKFQGIGMALSATITVIIVKEFFT